MNNRKKLRLISFIMFVVAVIFVICALSCPTCGSTIYIGSFALKAEHYLMGYAIYVVLMIALFVASFFVKNKSVK